MLTGVCGLQIGQRVVREFVSRHLSLEADKVGRRYASSLWLCIDFLISWLEQKIIPAAAGLPGTSFALPCKCGTHNAISMFCPNTTTDFIRSSVGSEENSNLHERCYFTIIGRLPGC